MPLWGEIYFSKIEVFFLLITFGGLTSFTISWHWYLPIFKFKPKSNSDRLKEFKNNIYQYPSILANFVPKFTPVNNLDSLRDINKSIAELWLSGSYFGIAALGLGGQAILWLSDFSSLTSGVYGVPLKFPLGRAFFSVFSFYFFLLGFSVFFVGVLAVFFSRRFK